MLRRLVLLAAVGLPLATARAGGPCRVHASLEPARGFVGQQVLYRQVLVRPQGPAPDFRVPPRFPGFRAEPLGASASTERIAGPGGGAVRVESRTALFPVRTGRWRLPEARLPCAGQEVVVAGPEFEALPPPEAGRPLDFSGVVGEVEMTAASEASVRLGGSLRLHVTSRGAANLWDADLRPEADPPDTEVFRRAPRVSLRGDTSLLVLRHDVFDLVPRRSGELRIAPLRIPYLDPGSGRYRLATTPARVVRVLPAAAEPERVTGSARPPAPGAAGARESGDARDGWGRLPLLLACGLVLLAAGTWLGWWRRRGRPDPVASWLREADHASGRAARAAALEHALRAHLAERGLDPLRSTTEALLERSPDEDTRACVRALVALERVRFDGTGRDADLDAIRSLLAPAPRRSPLP